MTRQPKAKGGRGAVKVRLTCLSDVIGETASIYRQMKARKLEHDEGRSLVWVLSQLRCMMEAQALERIEARLAEIEASTGAIGHGYQGAARQAITAH